jgi:hypothetical protein
VDARPADVTLIPFELGEHEPLLRPLAPIVVEYRIAAQDLPLQEGKVEIDSSAQANFVLQHTKVRMTRVSGLLLQGQSVHVDC